MPPSSPEKLSPRGVFSVFLSWAYYLAALATPTTYPRRLERRVTLHGQTSRRRSSGALVGVLLAAVARSMASVPPWVVPSLTELLGWTLVLQAILVHQQECLTFPALGLELILLLSENHLTSPWRVDSWRCCQSVSTPWHAWTYLCPPCSHAASSHRSHIANASRNAGAHLHRLNFLQMSNYRGSVPRDSDPCRTILLRTFPSRHCVVNPIDNGYDGWASLMAFGTCLGHSCAFSCTRIIQHRSLAQAAMQPFKKYLA